MISARRLLAEPLVQFLLIGIAIFGLYTLLNERPRETDRQVISVGPGRIEQLAETFSRTWQRPPTKDELDGLIDAFVKEEIFYRVGREMGLDRDDTVFRRRLMQKMQFLMEPSSAELTPREGELQAFLEANAEKFRTPAQVAFRQIYFDDGRREGGARDDAAALSARLNAGDTAAGDAGLGDPTLLPPRMPLTTLDRIAYGFGDAFAESLSQGEPGKWSGPLESAFGWHIVLIEEHHPARDQALDDIRDTVLREWQAEKRRQIAEARYMAMRENFNVEITWPSGERQAGADP